MQMWLPFLIYALAAFFGASLMAWELWLLKRNWSRSGWALRAQLAAVALFSFLFANMAIREIMVQTIGSPNFEGAGKAADGIYYLIRADGDKTPVSPLMFVVLQAWDSFIRGTWWTLVVIFPAALIGYILWTHRVPEVFSVMLESQRLADQRHANCADTPDSVYRNGGGLAVVWKQANQLWQFLPIAIGKKVRVALRILAGLLWCIVAIPMLLIATAIMYSVVHSVVAAFYIQIKAQSFESTPGIITRNEWSDVEHKHMLEYDYSVEGVEYHGEGLRGDTFWLGRSDKQRVKNYPVGKKVDVFYAPNDPRISMLEPGLVSQYFRLAIEALICGGMFLGIYILAIIGNWPNWRKNRRGSRQKEPDG